MADDRYRFISVDVDDDDDEVIIVGGDTVSPIVEEEPASVAYEHETFPDEPEATEPEEDASEEEEEDEGDIEVPFQNMQRMILLALALMVVLFALYYVFLR